jgi:hypothetical protein
MRLKTIKNGNGIALAVPKALISSGVAPLELGKTYEVEIKAE